MVYYESWDEFYRLAAQLYREQPLRVRWRRIGRSA
jgi:hypothetical protein